MKSSAKRPRVKRAKAKPAARVRPARPGQGNPHWFRSFVTVSKYLNWKTTSLERHHGIPKNAPITFSAGPGQENDRVTVRLGQALFQKRPLSLAIEFDQASIGQHGKLESDLTLAQIYSFEEAVRAVFRAAREQGLLPANGRDQ